MEKTSAMYGMSAYDIIYDTILLDAELASYQMSHNYEMFDGDDGYVSFLTEKVEEYEKACEEKYFSEENFGKYSTYDAMADFVETNIEKWKRKLKGLKRCKFKVVIEIEADTLKGADINLVAEQITHNVIIDPDLAYENVSVKVIGVKGEEVKE